ncbi:MAG: DAK2 domain-containing protein [Bacteroidales bacterium]|nr:DAK2 domain-containing protein [Bacteroidales bacterium]
MDTKTLTGNYFGTLVRQGAAQLHSDKDTINDLNVFPIPDGDTGDNMFMTIDSGCGTLADNASLGEAASSLSRGMLLGARGNSGVILSRIFAGIANGLSGVENADVQTLGRALECGVQESYKAVAVPVEGTMLTVFKDAVRKANSTIGPGTTFASYGEAFLAEMEASLERTPDLLDVLKKAGVIDSGGAGLVSIARGIMKAMSGQMVETSLPGSTSAKAVNLDSFTSDSTLEFGYCTEFLLRLQNSKVNTETFDEKEVRDYLKTKGDSIVCFKDGTIIKVHVHTMTPGDVLSHCQRWGEFLTVKIENMTLQHHETTIKDGFSKPHKRYAVVTVATGKGLVSALKEAGADTVIAGGQTMNPPVQAFLDAFEQLDAADIFVFPNNSNILMTARQAASMYKRSTVRVVPSRSIGEGYAAIASFDSSQTDADALEKALAEAMEGVETGMVSTAIRDAEGGVREGDFVGFVHGEILSHGEDRTEVLAGLCERIDAGDRDVVLLFYGQGVSEEEASAAEQCLSQRFPMTEFILGRGGQPVYDYIVILN